MRRKDREVTDIKEIESIISRADVCRVALANGNTPYIVVMNFGYSGEPDRRIFFHCAKKGKKLDMIRKNSYICFEFDTDHSLYVGRNACDFGMSYSSVVGWGNIVIITDDKEKSLGIDFIMRHYSGRSDYSYVQEVFEKMIVLRLDILEMTGKKCWY